MKTIHLTLLLAAALVGTVAPALLPANAQQTSEGLATNQPQTGEISNNVAPTADTLFDTNEPAGSNDVQELAGNSTTNAAAVPSFPGTQPQSTSQGARNGDSRYPDRRRNRQSSGQSPNYTREGNSRGGQSVSRTDSAPLPPGARPEFSAFRIIADRNIFDPNRRGSRPSGPRERTANVESFTLVGIMSYEKGIFAFFDGSSSAFRKALKQEDSIAGYRLAGIEPNAVKLANGTNEVELKVGMQLRREDQGSWVASAQPQTYTASSSTPGNATSGSTGSTQSDSGSSAAESDVLKRLRERREKE